MAPAVFRRTAWAVTLLTVSACVYFSFKCAAVVARTRSVSRAARLAARARKMGEEELLRRLAEMRRAQGRDAPAPAGQDAPAEEAAAGEEGADGAAPATAAEEAADRRSCGGCCCCLLLTTMLLLLLSLAAGVSVIPAKCWPASGPRFWHELLTLDHERCDREDVARVVQARQRELVHARDA